MLHPYQCLYYCQQANRSETGILVAASGCYIHTFNSQSGKHLSTWPSIEKDGQSQSVGDRNENELETLDRKVSRQGDSEPPTKRPKVSLARDESGSSSAEIVVAGDDDNGEWSSPRKIPVSQIIKLAGTANGEQVVAVTAEDKCIRVFDLATDGTLTQLSQR